VDLVVAQVGVDSDQEAVLDLDQEAAMDLVVLEVRI
jgi:hypothetical protein